jgi:type VI secretion system protein ImpA
MILVEDILKQKPGPPIETDGTLREGAGEAAVEASGPMTASPRDRADALRRLASVADFFRRTEPHSPVSYLVQRAARWGEMPLDEWLKEVVSDTAVLGHIRETLGLKEPSS